LEDVGHPGTAYSDDAIEVDRPYDAFVRALFPENWFARRR
jgi:hypothetical protein